MVRGVEDVESAQRRQKSCGDLGVVGRGEWKEERSGCGWVGSGGRNEQDEEKRCTRGLECRQTVTCYVNPRCSSEVLTCRRRFATSYGTKGTSRKAVQSERINVTANVDVVDTAGQIDDGKLVLTVRCCLRGWESRFQKAISLTPGCKQGLVISLSVSVRDTPVTG
jgi:hypothetical protein